MKLVIDVRDTLSVIKQVACRALERIYKLQSQYSETCCFRWGPEVLLQHSSDHLLAARRFDGLQDCQKPPYIGDFQDGLFIQAHAAYAESMSDVCRLLCFPRATIATSKKVATVRISKRPPVAFSNSKFEMAESLKSLSSSAECCQIWTARRAAHPENDRSLRLAGWSPDEEDEDFPGFVLDPPEKLRRLKTWYWVLWG